jgi:hypothetical protein
MLGGGMEDHNVAIGQLLVAHEQDIQTLRLEIETLRSDLKRLRADLLASLRYVRFPKANTVPIPSPPAPTR